MSEARLFSCLPQNRKAEVARQMSVVSNSPRLVIAGLAGDSGKSVVSMALLRALREAGTEVRAFKKGPDYIDTA